MGGVDWFSSGGHRLEEGDKGAVEGDGAGCSVKGLQWAKCIERGKVYDRG